MDLELAKGNVEHDGERIYWELVTAGSADERPVVVLSHGAGGSHAIWFQQIPALGAHFRVLTWDSRGYGNSTNRNNAPSAPAAASDLAAVLEALDIEQAHLIGQSMGGWATVAFAEAYPERVLTLTLADTVGGLWTPALQAAFAEFNERGGLAGTRAELVGGHRALWPGTRDRNPAHAFLYQALGSLHDPPMSQLGATLSWTVGHDAIEAIGVPVLFVAGVHDEIFPSNLLAESSRLIKGSSFVEIADAGHSPYFEQPQAWNEAVCSFLLVDKN